MSFDIAHASDLADARAWYRTLGFPDVKELPYVRVYTGGMKVRHLQPGVRRYVEGFLLGESPEAFTVFVSSVGHHDGNEADEGWRMRSPPSIQRFVRRADAPGWERSGSTGVSYEKLEFPGEARAALERARDQVNEGRFSAQRARKFAFAQACRQQGQPEIATALEQIVEQMQGRHDDQPAPARVLENLQQDLGDLVLENAELRFVELSVSWQDLLTPYEHFAELYPGNNRGEEARKKAAMLRQTIDEEANHHPKPYAGMTPTEKAAENIYQLRNLNFDYWSGGRYPIMVLDASGQLDLNTPAHRFVDLGDVAIPALIAAMDDPHFTRTQLHGLDWGPPITLRVGEVALGILEHIAHRSFSPSQNGNVKLTCRQLAEKWWADKQRKNKPPARTRR